MAFHRLAASCEASTRSCSLSHFLASLRVLILPSFVAMKYSSWSTSGGRYPNRLKTYLSASAGSMSSVTVIPQLSSFSKKRSRLRGLPLYVGGLMSFRSSHTAASAALETMNASREVDRGSHRRPPQTPTAATDAFPWGAGHGTLRWTRASEQAGKALRSQGHQCAHVM